MVENLDSATCGLFQFYFYNNIFYPVKNNKIQDKTKLNKRTIETLLNKLFVLNNQETNEATIRQYATDNNISIV